MNLADNITFKLLYLTGSDDTFYATKVVGSYNSLKELNKGVNEHRLICPKNWELLIEIEDK